MCTLVNVIFCRSNIMVKKKIVIHFIINSNKTHNILNRPHCARYEKEKKTYNLEKNHNVMINRIQHVALSRRRIIIRI